MNVIEIINKYVKIYKIPRTGWGIRGVKNPENISTHELSCLLLAFVLLPDNNPLNADYINFEEYNKNLILFLILIHDLGEIDIGDKVRGTKTDEEKKREYQSIHKFLTAVKLTNSNNMLYNYLDKLWVDMESGNPQNINAKVAKEIDYIQGAYQYFIYCIDGAVQFTRDSCYEWLNEVSDNKIMTSQGRKIRDELILNNPDFINHNILRNYFFDFKN